MSHNHGGGKKPTPPTCVGELADEKTCGARQVHPYLTDWGGYRWLCGDCAYREQVNPNPPPPVIPPRERRPAPLQTERLFEPDRRGQARPAEEPPYDPATSEIPF